MKSNSVIWNYLPKIQNLSRDLNMGGVAHHNAIFY